MCVVSVVVEVSLWGRMLGNSFFGGQGGSFVNVVCLFLSLFLCFVSLFAIRLFVSFYCFFFFLRHIFLIFLFSFFMY